MVRDSILLLRCSRCCQTVWTQAWIWQLNIKKLLLKGFDCIIIVCKVGCEGDFIRISISIVLWENTKSPRRLVISHGCCRWGQVLFKSTKHEFRQRRFIRKPSTKRMSYWCSLYNKLIVHKLLLWWINLVLWQVYIRRDNLHKIWIFTGILQCEFEWCMGSYDFVWAKLTRHFNLILSYQCNVIVI